jgi:hypothetical protein
MVAGVSKRLSNRCKAISSYFWDMTLEAASKMHLTSNGCVASLIKMLIRQSILVDCAFSPVPP